MLSHMKVGHMASCHIRMIITCYLTWLYHMCCTWHTSFPLSPGSPFSPFSPGSPWRNCQKSFGLLQRRFSYSFSLSQVWQSQVEIEHYSVAYLTALLRSKRCSAVFPLRAGLICAVKLHQCLISLHSTYEPPLMKVLRYSASNAVMWSKYTTE